MHVIRGVQHRLLAVERLDDVLREAHLLRDLARQLLVEVRSGADLFLRLLRARGAVDDPERGRRRVVVLVGRLLRWERLVRLLRRSSRLLGLLVVGRVNGRRAVLRKRDVALALALRGSLEQARDEALRDPALAEEVDQDGLHHAEALDVETLEELDAAEVLAGGVAARLVASIVEVHPRGILRLGEQEVVVDVRVRGRRLVRVQRRDLAARDAERAARGSSDKVGLSPADQTLAQEPVVDRGAREVVELAELVVPVPRSGKLLRRRRRRQQVRRLRAERVRDVLRGLDEVGRGRLSVRDRQGRNKFRLGQVGARRARNERREVLAERRRDVGEQLEKRVVRARTDALGQHGTRRRIERRVGSLGDPEAVDRTRDSVLLALERLHRDIDQLAAHAPRVWRRTPGRDAEGSNARVGGTGGAGVRHLSEEGILAEGLDLEVGERMGACRGRGRRRGNHGFRR